MRLAAGARLLRNRRLAYSSEKPARRANQRTVRHTIKTLSAITLANSANAAPYAANAISESNSSTRD